LAAVQLKFSVDRTAEAWRALEEKELLPADLREAIDRQINTVATNTARRL
jgi:hypothetical protein